MKKRHMIFVISIILVTISALACKIFLFKSTEEITKENFLSLIEKNYSVVDFNQSERNGKLIISGDLNKEDILSLSSEISKKVNLDIVDVLVFKDKPNKIENGFYVDGLTNEVTIRNKSKSIKISEFKEVQIDPTVKDITLEDAQYKSLKNMDGVLFIDISSNTLTENRIKEDLYLLAKIINNSNKDLKNIIITSNIGDVTYGVSLNNPDILKIIESYSL